MRERLARKLKVLSTQEKDREKDTFMVKYTRIMGARIPRKYTLYTCCKGQYIWMPLDEKKARSMRECYFDSGNVYSNAMDYARIGIG